MNTVTNLDLNHSIRIDYKVTHHFMVEQAMRVSQAVMSPVDIGKLDSRHADAVRAVVEELSKRIHERGLTSYIIDTLFFPRVAEPTRTRGGFANWNGLAAGEHVLVAAVRRVGDVAYSSIIVPAVKVNTVGGDDIKYYILSPAHYEEATKARTPRGLRFEYRDIARVVKALPRVGNIVFKTPSITLPRMLSSLYHRLSQPMHKQLAEFCSSIQTTAANRFAGRVAGPVIQDPKGWLNWFGAAAKGELLPMPAAMTNLLNEYHAAMREAEQGMLGFEHNKVVMFVQFVKDGETYAVLPNNTFVQATPDAPIPMEAMHRAQAVVMQRANMKQKECTVLKYAGGRATMSINTEMLVLPGVGVELKHDEYAAMYPVHKLIVVPVSDAELEGVLA
jgi:hypothetical protein